MKIIHITASYKPAYIYGGPIQSVAKLCEALKRIIDRQVTAGNDLPSVHDLQVLTTTANGKIELEMATGKLNLVEGVPVRYFKRITKDHSHFSPQLLLNLRNQIFYSLQNEKPIIHIHAWWNLVSVLSCWVARRYKVPVLLSPRGMLTAYTQKNRNSFSKKIIHSFIGRSLLEYCHLHATSEQEKQDILKIITPKSITVIPNLVKIEEPVGVPQLTISKKNPTVFRLIFLSRVEEKKGLKLLFEALSLLEINWQLTIAGSGKDQYINDLKLKAEQLNIGEHINWIGQISNEDKYRLMAQQDLLVLTSFNENFANVVVESLSVGTPVLVSDKVGLSDYIIDQQLGWVSPLDIDSIKKNLQTAFSQQKKREMIKQSAPEIIRKDFNDEVLANRYLQLYKSFFNE